MSHSKSTENLKYVIDIILSFSFINVINIRYFPRPWGPTQQSVDGLSSCPIGVPSLDLLQVLIDEISDLMINLKLTETTIAVFYYS